MKNLKDYILTENNFFKNLGIGMRSQIEKWLDEHKITNYTINDDLTIDIRGSVDLMYYKEERLPEYIQFGKVTGIFSCSNCLKLKSLKGAPKEVGGHFYCYKCENLESLEGSPKYVGGDFYCSSCESLKSLEGAPKEVGGKFDCGDCKNLESLEGSPKEVGYDFYCSSCPELTSLEGAPEKVDGGFYCKFCGKQFTIDDVRKVSKVKRRINV